MNPSQEKYKRRTQNFIKLLIDGSNIKDKDVLVIASYISHYNFISKWVLEIFSEEFEKVFLVSGNHDYYLLSKNQNKKYGGSSVNRIKELSRMTEKLENVTYFHSLLGNNYETYKGITFVGLTMTSLPETDKKCHFISML